MRSTLLLAILASTLNIPTFAAQGTKDGVKPPLASGTLDLVLGNKNGFVIAADSRRSSDSQLLCNGQLSLQCDDSQKLFRTGSKSAMVIAGFATGRYIELPELSIASMLRRRFGETGLPDEEGTPEFARGWAAESLGQALVASASFYDEGTPPNKLEFIAYFVGFDKSGSPLIRAVQFWPTWKVTNIPNVKIPVYEVTNVGLTVTKFVAQSAGIGCIADLVIQGLYKSDDPTINAYYQRLKNNQLDDMPLAEMRALAETILHETEKFTDYVGGPDQIAMIPANGEPQWPHVKLPSSTQLSPNFMLWTEGFLSPKSSPEYRKPGLTFFADYQHPLKDALSEFFLATQFKGIPVIIDGNTFMRTRFDDVTLKWSGGNFFMFDNRFTHCVLELPEGKNPPANSQLQTSGCTLVHKKEVTVDPAMVGSPKKMTSQGCINQGPQGGVKITAGGDCGNVAAVVGPKLDP
jgi:hypothetical protein